MIRLVSLAVLLNVCYKKAICNIFFCGIFMMSCFEILKKKIFDSGLLNNAITVVDSSSYYGNNKGHLPLIIIDTDYCHAVFSLQGAQLLEFVSKQKEYNKSLLWISSNSAFETGKAIRGGIPFCGPWFGTHSDSSKPKHGFLRNRDWTLIECTHNSDNSFRIVFEFLSEENDLLLFPYSFSVRLSFVLKEDIFIEVNVANLSSTIMPFSWALHSYFLISGIDKVQIQGLENQNYLDATKNFMKFKQVGPIKFEGEVDRIYESVSKTQSIVDINSVYIEGVNCNTAIIWNPGLKLATQMPDVGSEGFKYYVCLERGAASADTWLLDPKEIRISTLRIRS